MTYSLANYKLQQNGQYKGQCPFRENHEGKADGSKSFFMTPERGTYHCFSCGAKGSLLTLLTRKFGMSFGEAVTLTSNTEYVHKQDTDLHVDWSTPPKVFLDRGFTPRLLKRFKVGSHKDKKGGEVTEIPQYRNGELIGVTYRVQRGKNKIVWSTDGFDKSSMLYGMDFIKTRNYVIVVEGWADCWRLYSYGYNVVALQGTAVSLAQVEWLSEFETVYSALDNDEAGVRGAEVLYEYLRFQTDVNFIPYDSHDPDLCSEEDFTEAFNNAKSYLEFTVFMRGMLPSVYAKKSKGLYP